MKRIQTALAIYHRLLVFVFASISGGMFIASIIDTRNGRISDGRHIATLVLWLFGGLLFLQTIPYTFHDPFTTDPYWKPAHSRARLLLMWVLVLSFAAVAFLLARAGIHVYIALWLSDRPLRWVYPINFSVTLMSGLAMLLGREFFRDRLVTFFVHFHNVARYRAYIHAQIQALAAVTLISVAGFTELGLYGHVSLAIDRDFAIVVLILVFACLYVPVNFIEGFGKEFLNLVDTLHGRLSEQLWKKLVSKLFVCSLVTGSLEMLYEFVTGSF